MEFSWNPNTKCTERSLNLLFQRTLFLMLSIFQKYFNTYVRNNKLVNSFVYHPCPSRLASMITSFHISLNSRVLSLSRMLVEFPLICIFHISHFSIHGAQITRKFIESVHIYWCPISPLKSSFRISWKSVSHNTKGVEETMNCFIKIQSENMKMSWDFSFFILCMICNFSKFCDGFTVLWIIYIRQCGIKFLASPLHPW